MVAIIKKEFLTYFKSMTGYVFMASFLFFVGLFFVTNNLLILNPQYSGVLSSSTFVFLLIVPVLTMRLMAEETRQKTDQLLLTSPVSLGRIVMGKYLGAVSVFLITLAITFIYPLILSTMGTIFWGEIIGGYIGFFLLGSALIAVGLFVSSLTDNQVIAAVATFTVLLVLWLMDAIIGSLPADQTSGLIFALILVAAIAFVFYSATRNLFVSGGVLLIGILAVAAGFIIKPSLYNGFIGRVFGWLALHSHYQDFAMGIFSLTPIVYYITFSTVFLYLTVRMLEKKRWS